MADRPVAFVTGASRGIGKAIAVHLARSGFDVALTARTVADGEAREHSSTLHKSDTRPLPGSLASTADLVEAAGVRSLTVPADLTDRPSVTAAGESVLDAWGRVDVLVNNGRYVGPGHMDRFEETPLELLDAHLEANVMAPLALTKVVLPGMLDRGSGCIVNITSGAGYADPPAPAGKGGWGLGYGMSKGALHRVAGILALELGDRGIRAYNVQPGFIATERMVQDMAEFGFDASAGAPPDVVGAVVAWLVTDPEAAEPNGRNLEAQDVCRELGLLAGWPPA
jgi:NAD(P)-dependent dehydrogenase (short-subunit alcohol dehydrogenase family)